MTSVETSEVTKPRPSVGRMAGIVAVFALIGPPVGALASALLLGGFAAGADLAADGWPERIRTVFGAMALGVVYGVPLSYLMGAAPGFLVGVATAAWAARRGTISLYVSLGAALVLGALAALRQGDPLLASEGERAAQAIVLVAHLAAAGVCWLVAKAIFGRPGVADIPPSRGKPR